MAHRKGAKARAKGVWALALLCAFVPAPKTRASFSPAKPTLGEGRKAAERVTRLLPKPPTVLGYTHGRNPRLDMERNVG